MIKPSPYTPQHPNATEIEISVAQEIVRWQDRNPGYPLKKEMCAIIPRVAREGTQWYGFCVMTFQHLEAYRWIDRDDARGGVWRNALLRVAQFYETGTYNTARPKTEREDI